MQRYLYDCGVRCNTLDVIVMKRHTSVIGSHTGLWTMMLSAGVLAVLLLACAGTAAAGVDRVHPTCASICVGLCRFKKGF
jgi:hypothetical protein